MLFERAKEATMNSEQIALVQNTWEKVLPISETAAELFYNRLFETDPSAAPLFTVSLRAMHRTLSLSETVT